jgi:hypothetical protein
MLTRFALVLVTGLVAGLLLAQMLQYGVAAVIIVAAGTTVGLAAVLTAGAARRRRRVRRRQATLPGSNARLAGAGRRTRASTEHNASGCGDTLNSATAPMNAALPARESVGARNA